MAWHQLSIITDEKTAADIADFFSESGAVSVTYMDAEDQPVYEPPPGETKIWKHTKVIALFELHFEPELIKSLLYAQFDHSVIQHWQQQKLEDRVWERSWMDHYQAMKFGDSLWICPTGQEKQEPGCVCMILDPGLAFGTGTHATTALCLQWLANQNLSQKVVIDYGCGSGILAVAAVLLGAKEAHAIDIDPQALTATQANAKKNKVSEKIKCYLPEQFKSFQADIILANILANPLCELSGSISTLVKTSGHLILSGILKEQAETVKHCYQTHNIQFQPVVSQEDWCRLDGINLG